MNLHRLSPKVLSSIILCLFTFSCLFIWTLFPSEQSSQSLCGQPCSSNSEDTDRHNGWTCSEDQHRLAIVVPFRERTNELLRLVPHLHQFLRRQAICHRFYIINQVDKYRFNRGMLINIGFLFASNESTYMAMHDVDLLPINDQLSYQFPSNGPFHLSAPNLHPKYHYEKYVGGILLIQNRHFVQVNGFSTRYWGWGLEDDEFYTRLRESNLEIYRPHNILTNSSNSFLHLHDQSVHKRDTAKLFNQREVTRKKDRQTGLNTTRFQLLQVHRLTVEGVPFRVFDVALHCDTNSTPWCERGSSSGTATRQTKRAKTTAP